MAKIRKNVSIDEDLISRGEEFADRMGLSFSALISISLFDYMQQKTVIEELPNIKAMFDKFSPNQELANLLSDRKNN